MKILLNGGLYTLVDKQDYPLVLSFNWKAVPNRRTHYVASSYKSRGIFLHRLILNPLPMFQVDHINGNGLDNRRKNLRIVTSQMNAWNRQRAIIKPKTSQYKGVSKHNGKWRAQITINDKRITIGRYNSELEAAQAFDKMALEHYGPVTFTNFPHKSDSLGQGVFI